MTLHKATGGLLCVLLVATPLLLFWGHDASAVKNGWQWKFSPQNLISASSGQVNGFTEWRQRLQPLPLALTKGVDDAAHAISESILSAATHLGNLWKASIGHISYISKSWRPKSAVHQIKETADRGWGYVKQGWEWVAPGGKLHPQEFLEKYYGHIFIEIILAVVIGFMFLQSSFQSSKRSSKPLTEEEIDELCEEWQPQPLYQTFQVPKLDYNPPVLESATGAYVRIGDKKVLNMVAYNFLGIAGNEKILADCKAAVNKYGVGACGPRGFYGTIDVHLELEKRLAKFLQREEAIIYAYDLSTLPSVLPAFANTKDLIVVDEEADYAIQNGCHLSRAKIVTFKHNDIEDLERVLREEVTKHAKQKKPLNRRFIVVEGIYKASGDIAPLDGIVKLKHKYKFRLIVDESFSFGVLGNSGRGACEHFGLGSNDVEIVCSSLGNAVASVGGFCVGSREIVDHQRLSGLGYCFSAALPPYLAVASIGALDILESAQAGELLATLRDNAQYIRSALKSIKGLKVVGTERDSLSPIVHLELAEPIDDQEANLQTLQNIVDRVLKRHDVLITVNKVSVLDKLIVNASLRLVVTSSHTKQDIDKAVSGLKRAVTVEYA